MTVIFVVTNTLKMQQTFKSVCIKFTRVHAKNSQLSRKKKAADPKTDGCLLATNDRAQDKDRSDATERDVDVDIYAYVEP